MPLLAIRPRPFDTDSDTDTDPEHASLSTVTNSRKQATDRIPPHPKKHRSRPHDPTHPVTRSNTPPRLCGRLSGWKPRLKACPFWQFQSRVPSTPIPIPIPTPSMLRYLPLRTAASRQRIGSHPTQKSIDQGLDPTHPVTKVENATAPSAGDSPDGRARLKRRAPSGNQPASTSIPIPRPIPTPSMLRYLPLRIVASRQRIHPTQKSIDQGLDPTHPVTRSKTPPRLCASARDFPDPDGKAATFSGNLRQSSGRSPTIARRRGLGRRSILSTQGFLFRSWFAGLAGPAQASRAGPLWWGPPRPPGGLRGA